MADIDMIPRSYREGLRVQRALRTYGVALAVLLVAGVGAAAGLRWRIAVDTPRLEQLRERTAQAEALRAQLAAAAQRKSALEQDARALAALRGAGGIAALARTLDTALNDKVWFDQLQFARTEELLREPLPAPLPPGAVQTRGAAKPGAPAGPQTWNLANHVEIAGHALDHAALTGFLSALSHDPALADVRFLNSNAAPTDGDGAVSFSVAGAVRAAGATP